MRTVGNVIDQRFKDRLRKSLTEAIADAVEEALNETDLINKGTLLAVEQHLQTILDSDEMKCWLDFYADGPEVLVGIGPGDVVAKFIPELSVQGYEGGAHGEAQRHDVMEKINGIRSFMELCKKEITVLEQQLKPGESDDDE